MADMKLVDRVNDLERRVSELEGSFGFLTEQVKGVHRSLLEFQGETRERFDGVDARFDGVDSRFDRMNAKLDAMPEIIASSVADALRS